MDLLNSIFSFFFGKTDTIDDSFFGKLLHTGEGYEGEKLFTPTGVDVGIKIDEQEEGQISLDQVNFFKWVEKNYDELLRSIKSDIEFEVRNYIDGYEIESIENDLEFVHLRIPNLALGHQNWEIVFYECNRFNHYLFITLHQREVLSIQIDG